MPTPADPLHLLCALTDSDPSAVEQSWHQTPQLLSALKAARMSAWCWDMESGDIRWSEGSQALFGLPARHALPSHLDQLSAIGPRRNVCLMPC